MLISALACLEVVSILNNLNIDVRGVIKEYGLQNSQIDTNELLKIAKDKGFKAKVKNISITKLCAYPLPAILIQENNNYCVVLKINKKNQSAGIYFPHEKETREVSFDEVERISQGFVVLTHKQSLDSVKFGFKWFFVEILKYKRIVSEVLIASFIIQLFGLVTPLFTQVILDKVIVHRSLLTLNVLAFAFVAVMIFEFIMTLCRKYIFIHTASKIDAKLGAKLFKHLFSLPFPYFENRKVGNIISRIKELDVIREFITNKSISVIVDSFFSVIFVAMMLLYSVKLTLVSVFFVSLIAVLYLVVTPELRDRLEAKFQMGAKSHSYLVESTTGVQTVKSLAIEGNMQRNWEDTLAKYIKSSFKLSNLANISGAFSGLFQKAMTICILYIGVKLVIENKLTIGQLIAFQMFANQFSAPVLRLVNLWNEFQQALLAVDRLGDILNHPIEVKNSKAITLPKLKGKLKFENLCFRYNNDSPYVINNLTLEIKSGQSIGIVGKSGSGKSTLAKLIQRLYIANEGSIFLDDIDLKHINPMWLRHNIGVVLQENFLFSGTIRDNISSPFPSASMEMILQASKIAGAHDFIAQMPEGYDTHVGERGSLLSGGQKQRIAIARAIITNPKILVFDEATSALDYESESIIMQNLSEIKEGRTIVMIAHRLSTIRNCDKIAVLEKGRLEEFGTHYELLENRAYYYDLQNKQGSLL